jgi:hypothetical protein
MARLRKTCIWYAPIKHEKKMQLKYFYFLIAPGPVRSGLITPRGLLGARDYPVEAAIGWSPVAQPATSTLQ